MKFIFGIGNPGAKYEATRHNIGYMVLNAISKGSKWVVDDRLMSGTGLTKSFVIKRPDSILVQPQLRYQIFVNNSGDVVAEIINKYKTEPKDILVVCDDVNLAFGKLRLRESGSAGGHHGLESIIQSLGSDDFPRLRIGVGNDKMPKDLASFVLEEFSTEEKKGLNKVLEKAVLICEAWEKEGFGSARNLLSQFIRV